MFSHWIYHDLRPHAARLQIPTCYGSPLTRRKTCWAAAGSLYGALLAEVPGICYPRLTITYHGGRGSASNRECVSADLG